MSINTQIKISLSLISFMFLDLFLFTTLFNTFFSFNLFFVNIFLLGRKYFSNKLIILIMIIGMFYESFFSTNYIGIITAGIFLVLIFSNLTILVDSKVVLFFIFSISYFIFYSSLRAGVNFLNLNFLISLLLNFLIFYQIDKLIKRDV
jgi:hypothetical protein